MQLQWYRKMGKITVETCDIEGLKVITPTVFGDERGYFMETYNYNDYKAAGIDQKFVQDNQSSSKKGVLRGLHFQKDPKCQAKIVEVISTVCFSNILLYIYFRVNKVVNIDIIIIERNPNPFIMVMNPSLI